MNYDRLERDEARPKSVRDWTERWNALEPVADADDTTAAALRRFCESKRISAHALTALGARVARHRGRLCLAFAGTNGNGRVVALKYRPVDGTSNDTDHEHPSVWLRPIIAGQRDSLDWLIAEGETDAARLYDLVGDRCAVLALPAGAKTFKREWVQLIPRGASVFLCHDADEHGDQGAAKAAAVLGGTTTRVRPPEGAKDWCDWNGSRDEFVELVKTAAATHGREFQWQPLSDIVDKPIVFIEKPHFQAAAFHLFCGIKNSGKGTLLAWLAARLTRGELGARRSVVWIALGEDSYAIDVRPRIKAAGGNPGRVTVLARGQLVLPDHVSELERVAAELDDVGLIVLDPVGGTLAGGKSTNFDADVRPALTSLNDLADATGAMVFGVRHFSIKPDRRAGGTLAAILGSSDWANVPRAVLALVHDDADSDIRHLFVVTGNRVRGDSPGRMFRIEGHVLPGHTEEVTRAVLLGESAKDPDELLAAKRARKTTKSDAARNLILDALARAPGHQMESDQLDAEIARRAGIAAKTVRNLRGDMKNEGLVRSVPDKDDEGEIKRWFVTLTGAGILAHAGLKTQSPPTHDITGSGQNKPNSPEPEFAPVDSGSGSRALDDGDFVT